MRPSSAGVLPAGSNDWLANAAFEAGEALRAVITRIVLTPAGDRLEVKLYGDLAEIVALRESPPTNKNGAIPGGTAPLLSVVAGRGFEPLTFRL